MYSNFTWILLLILQLVYVSPRAIEVYTTRPVTDQELPYRANDTNWNEGISKPGKEKVISIRITSSVAIARGREKATQITEPRTELSTQATLSTSETYNESDDDKRHINKNLEGANLEFLKQLEAKKSSENLEQIPPYKMIIPQRYNESEYNDEIVDYGTQYRNTDNIAASDNMQSSSQDVNYCKEIEEIESSLLHEALKYTKDRITSNATDDLSAKTESQEFFEITSPSTELDESYFNHNETDNDDSIAEPSTKEIEISDKNNENYENIENVPLARSVVQSPSSKNFIQGLTNKPPSERESSTRLTTISFNVVHDAPKPQTNTFENSNQHERHKFYDPPKVYSQPAQIYSEPAKFYSEPAKVYSEPSKIYSVPAKVYSEPAKIYSEPSKFYSEPASLHLRANAPTNYSPTTTWQQHTQAPSTTRIFNTTPATGVTVPRLRTSSRIPEHQPERNYEVDEKVSVLSDGRSHGVQESTTEKCKQESCKVGYVVKGRQYNKYRVEERTSDGYIVGEYGVVRNEDGALRGVRYTADSDASPRLIHDALMKFLQLK